MCNIPHAPSTVLSGTQFSTLNGACINDPEGPEKYNNTEVKYGAEQVAFSILHCWAFSNKGLCCSLFYIELLFKS
jgi:hypothetical protein